MLDKIYLKAKSLNDESYLAKIYNLYALQYKNLDKNVKAHSSYLKSLKIFQKLELVNKEAGLLCNLGVFFGQNIKNQDKALEYLNNLSSTKKTAIID